MTAYTVLASSNPIHHVVDHVFFKSNGLTVVSNHMLMQITAALLLMLILPMVFKLRQTGDEVSDLTPHGLGNFFESICSYLRTEVARPALGKYTDGFIPYIWTVFFFVLFCNLLGLLPLPAVTKWLFGVGIGGAATGNIWVTATLAICTLFMIVVNGLRENGIYYIKHFFMGPALIAPLIAVLEVIGLFAKTFALAVRLFANMIAGHILLAVLLSFIGMAGANSAGLGFAIAVPVVLGSVAINMLELFVAFLQAFIFTFLTVIFISQAVVIHHDEHGHEGDAEVAH